MSDPRTFGSPALAGGPLEGKRAAPQPPQRRTLSHLVRPRETLASLARRYYQNDTERWREIFIANQDQIADPHRLSTGLVLNIPGAILWREPEASVGKNASRKPASRPSLTRPSGGGGAFPPQTQGGAAAGGLGGRARGANG